MQTDISGPITASDLTNAGLGHTKFTKPGGDLQASVTSQDNSNQDTVDQTSLETVQGVDTRELGSHEGLDASLAQDELQEGSSDAKEDETIKQTALAHHQQTGGDEENNVATTSVAYSSPPFQGKY